MEITHRPYPYYLPLPGVATPRSPARVEPATAPAAPAERVMEGEWMEAGANADYAPWCERLGSAMPRAPAAPAAPAFAAAMYRTHSEPERPAARFDAYA